MGPSECIFCRIVRGEIPSDTVHSDDEVVAFRDVNPVAPVHVLVIPREHVASVDALREEHTSLVGRMVLTARDLARSEGVAADGYRLVLNTGAGAGQSVFHVHLHLLGGRGMAWPPG